MNEVFKTGNRYAASLVMEAAFAGDEDDIDVDNKEQDTDMADSPVIDQQTKNLVLKSLLHIHSNMNHLNNRALVAFLRKRGTQPWVLKLAADLKCDICDQWKKRNPLPVASGKVSEPLETLQMDGIDWIHPLNETRSRGLFWLTRVAGRRCL